MLNCVEKETEIQAQIEIRNANEWVGALHRSLVGKIERKIMPLVHMPREC